MSKVLLTHESGLKKEVKCGFSWTVFFFGFLVPLIRGDLKGAAIMFVLEVGLWASTGEGGIWIVGLIFCFTYNKLYINELLKKGYKPENETEKTKLIGYGILMPKR